MHCNRLNINHNTLLFRLLLWQWVHDVGNFSWPVRQRGIPTVAAADFIQTD